MALVGPKSIDIAAAASGLEAAADEEREPVPVSTRRRANRRRSAASRRRRGHRARTGRRPREGRRRRASAADSTCAGDVERQLEERRLRARWAHTAVHRRPPGCDERRRDWRTRRRDRAKNISPNRDSSTSAAEVAGIPRSPRRRTPTRRPMIGRRSCLDHLGRHVDADDAAGRNRRARRPAGSSRPYRSRCRPPSRPVAARPRRTATRTRAPAARRGRRPSTPTAPPWRRPTRPWSAGRRRSATSSTRATTSWAQAMNASTSPPPGSTTSSHGASCRRRRGRARRPARRAVGRRSARSLGESLQRHRAAPLPTGAHGGPTRRARARGR